VKALSPTKRPVSTVNNPQEDTVTDRIAPNPYSPYADADPSYRHVVPSLFGMDPPAGRLVPGACGRMVVTPSEPLQESDGTELPEGMCPACMTVVQGGPELPIERGTCRECGGDSSHGDLCALCRQELHEAWWPTRDTAEAAS
jgi:hypothetical protein